MVGIALAATGEKQQLASAARAEAHEFAHVVWYREPGLRKLYVSLAEHKLDDVQTDNTLA